METIWKYTLKIADEQEVDMPSGAGILCVQMQHGTLCLWAVADPDHDVRPHVIRIRGTGHRVEPGIGKYIGTAQDSMGLVWHVFDGGEATDGT